MQYRLLAISGSLRADSFNSALLRSAEEMDERFAWDFASIGDIPLYNTDLDGESPPAAVARFKEQIRAADALLIATPEYNYSVPGVLKNAIDWASRPGYKSVFVHKPVGLLGASGSVVGTARAQAHLREVMAAVLASVFPHPDFLVGQATRQFTGGNLSDQKTREMLNEYLQQFESWVGRTSQK